MKLRTSVLFSFAIAVVQISYIENHSNADEGSTYNATLCDSILQKIGCYKRWDYTRCVHHIRKANGIDANKHGFATGTFLLPTSEALAHAIDKSIIPVERQEELDSPSSNRYDTPFCLGSHIPGVWTLDALLEANTVTTTLSLLLDDDECCNASFVKTVTGQVFAYGGNSSWQVEIVGEVSIRDGVKILRTANVCCTEAFRPQNAHSLQKLRTSRENLFDSGKARLLKAEGESDDTGCNMTAAELFATVSLLASPETELGPYLEKFGNANSTASGTTADISVTWFIAKQNSEDFVIWMAHEIVGSNLADNYDKTTSSFEACATMCKNHADCNAVSYDEKSQQCTLKHVEQDVKPQGAHGVNSGFLGQSASDDPSSHYLLYHMLPGAYCADDLVAAGQMNTTLGNALGISLTLEFKNQDGQLILLAPSAMLDDTGNKLFQTETKQLRVVEQYYVCRSVVYVVEDDFFPTSLVNSIDSRVPSVDNTWDFLTDLTAEYNTSTLGGACGKPLPAYNSSLAAGGTTGQDVVGETTDSSGGSSNGSGLSGGVIAAIVLGSIAAVLLAVVAGLLVWLRLKRQKTSQQDAHPSGKQLTGGWQPSVMMTLMAGEDTPQSTGEPNTPLNQNREVDEYFETMRDWVIHGVVIQNEVGRGSFGAVYLGCWHNTPVAVKRFDGFKVGGTDDDAWRNHLMSMQKEVSIMSGLRHPNVVQFLGVTINPPAVVTEFCQYGSLYGLLHKASQDPTFLENINWKRRLSMAIDAAKGMQFLHSRAVPIIHRDLKSPNLLVDKSWTVKVSDFGLSKMVDLAASKTSVSAFNPRWLAPELIDTRGGCARSTPASDVYAFGVIMWELLTLREPFKGVPTAQIIFHVVQHRMRPEIPPTEELPGNEAYPGLDQYVALIQSCWDQDAAARPDVHTLVDKLWSIRRSAFGAGPPSRPIT